MKIKKNKKQELISLFLSALASGRGYHDRLEFNYFSYPKDARVALWRLAKPTGDGVRTLWKWVNRHHLAGKRVTKVSGDIAKLISKRKTVSDLVELILQEAKDPATAHYARMFLNVLAAQSCTSSLYREEIERQILAILDGHTEASYFMNQEIMGFYFNRVAAYAPAEYPVLSSSDVENWLPTVVSTPRYLEKLPRGRAEEIKAAITWYRLAALSTY